MGLISHRVKRSDLRVADHIYTWSNFYVFSHHGIYVGEDQVVHFNLEQQSCSCRNNSTSTSSLSVVPTRSVGCCDCCFSNKTSGVISSCLDCFLGNGSLHRFEYGVNWLTFTTKFRGGTCTTAKSDPCEVVIHRAKYLLRNGFGKYDLFTNNCEDFAMYCKTGFLGCSVQVSSVEAIGIATIVSLSFRLFLSAPVVISAATAAYFFTMGASEISVRYRSTKVEVEDIASFVSK